MTSIAIDIIIDDLNDFASSKTATNHCVVIDDLNSYAEPMPFWLSNGTSGDNAVFLTVDRSGVIAGTVKVQGVLQIKSKVNLYFRKSGALIQSAFTNSSGAFSFACGLNRNVADYYVVAVTDEPYNAQVFDKLTPA